MEKQARFVLAHWQTCTCPSIISLSLLRAVLWACDHLTSHYLILLLQYDFGPRNLRKGHVDESVKAIPLESLVTAQHKHLLYTSRISMIVVCWNGDLASSAMQSSEDDSSRGIRLELGVCTRVVFLRNKLRQNTEKDLVWPFGWPPRVGVVDLRFPSEMTSTCHGRKIK